MVKQVDAPGMSSSMGIMPIHVPTIAVLKPGVVRVYELDGMVVKYKVNLHTFIAFAFRDIQKVFRLLRLNFDECGWKLSNFG